MAALLAEGHRDPWAYTPRQALAYAELAARRANAAELGGLASHRLAYHGDRKAVMKRFKELLRWT